MGKQGTSLVGDAARPWWSRESLRYVDSRLHLAGRDVGALAAELGTPLFLYDRRRLLEKASLLHAALDRRGLRHRIFYAMKANRFVPLLCHLQASGLCGIDACSPGEIRLARQVGFAEEDISFTATSLSRDDLRALARHPGVTVNCDSFSTLRRLAELCPGRRVGLRIDPGLGLAYRNQARLSYGGRRHAKLGIALEDAAAAVALAQESGLEVDGLHVHAGCGYLNNQLPILDEILARLREVAEALPNFRRINIGGGLGSPLTDRDRPLDLDAWAAVVERRLGHGLGDVEIQVEPGDFLVKDSGVLVCRVASVESKNGLRFIGVDAGFNIQILPATYELPLEPVPCEEPLGDEREAATVVGNINEVSDVFGIDLALPRIEEASYLAFLGAGGYGSSMSSQHCLRGDFTEVLL